MNKEELTTNIYRAFQNEKIFYKIQIKDSTDTVYFEGNLYTEQIQNGSKIENLDKKIMEAIKDIPKRIICPDVI